MDRLKQFSKELRANSTDAERLLWSRVRAHRLFGFKFKRQQTIGRYIVDFACLDKKLIVELDGGQHADSESDQQRDAWLRERGFRVLRFWNSDVLLNIDGVMEVVTRALVHHPLPNPPPSRGRESKKTPLP
jgi:very-short-patch-repair endonuclease